MTSNHHALYDLGYTRTTMALNKEKQDREVEQNSETTSQFGLQAATRLHEVGIASNRGSACHGEYVPGPCTHRPSSHESRGVPMAAMMGKEWGGMGQNYLRSLLALGFQAFLIIVCVAIYAVLVQNIALEDDIIMAIWSCVGYTVLLCFTLFKTGSLAKSVFQAH